jgi:hypothetical protein
VVNSPVSLVEDRERRLVRMHVKTDPTDTVNHQALLSYNCRPRAEGANLSAKTYPAACAGSAGYFDIAAADPP